MKRKLLVLLLCASMAASLVSAPALATDSGAPADTVSDDGGPPGEDTAETCDLEVVSLAAKPAGPDEEAAEVMVASDEVVTLQALDSRVEKAISWAIAIANDDSHGYSQPHRYGPDYDCSSFVSTAFKQGGFNVSSTNTTWTMENAFKSVGFKAYAAGSVTLQRGDILLNPESHVELYLGGNKCVAAHGPFDNDTGDSTGHEIEVRSKAYCEFCNDKKYTRVLRYPGTSPAPTVKEYFNCKVKIYTTKGKRVNLYSSPTSSSAITYFDQGQTADSTYGAKLSDGSTWYKTQAKHNGVATTFWLNAGSPGVTVKNVKVPPSISVSPSTVSIAPGKSKTVTITFKGDDVKKMGGSIKGTSICSVAWADTDTSDGNTSVKITGKQEGEATVTINLLDANEKVLCSKDIHVTVIEESVLISASTSALTLNLPDSAEGSVYLNISGPYGGVTSHYTGDGDIFYGLYDSGSGNIEASFTGSKAGIVDYTIDVYNKAGTKVVASKTIRVTVTAATYTVSYNANDGSGAPASQTKRYGEDLALSSAIPIRPGYEFVGWAKQSSASSADYAPGYLFSSNQNITLYAVWKKAPAKVTGVSLCNSFLSMTANDSVTLIATVVPTDAADQRVEWSSSDPSMARVSSDGLVDCLKPGTVTITATTVDGGFTDSCVITFTPSVTGVSLNRKSLTLNVGESQTLTAAVAPADAGNQTVKWFSDDYNVASVENGVVEGLSEGTTTITATTEDGAYTDSCLVTVKNDTVHVTGISLSTKSMTLPVGGSAPLSATLTPANASFEDIHWSSSDDSVAAMDFDGSVKGYKPGTAVITVSTGDGSVADSCIVTVTDSPASDGPTITVKNATGRPGGTVSVDLVLSGNTVGLTTLTLTMQPPPGFTLTEIIQGGKEGLASLEFTPPGNLDDNPVNLFWLGADADYSNGTLVKMVFDVSSSLPEGQYEVEMIATAADNVPQAIPIDIVSTPIKLSSYRRGDLNMDGKINGIDSVLLKRYLVGGYKLDENVLASISKTADVNGDSRVDGIDSVILKRYLVGGYGVEL